MVTGAGSLATFGDVILVSVTAARADAASKHAHLRDIGLPTMFGAVVLLVSATLLLGVNISALRGNLKWMEHAQQVVTHLDVLEAAVLSEELTIRGYALTGDQRFLEFQQNERARSHDALAELQHLAASEPRRAAEFNAVERYTLHHRDVFGNLALTGPDRAAVVSRAILDPNVRETMRRTRRAMETLRAAELSDLGVHQRDITNQIGRAFLLAVGIILAAFVLGGVGVWVAQLKAPQYR